MNKCVVIVIVTLLSIVSSSSAQQVQVSTDFLTRSSFKDGEGTRLGAGDMNQYMLRYQQPLSLKVNERGQPITWSASLNGKYAHLRNQGGAATVNPTDIVNVSFNVSHMRPISERWDIVASLGFGVYSSPSEIRWSSILANGACVFIYKLNDHFSFGGGIALTNSYGMPMVMPVGYFRWNTKGRFEFDINMSNGIKATAAAWFGDRFKLTCNILEMDGVSSVVQTENTTKIYSSMSMRSFLTPTFYLTKRFSVFIDAGLNIMRTSKITDRKIKYMFSSGSDKGKYRFNPSLRLGIGVRYGF